MTKVKIQIMRGRNTLYQRGTFDKRRKKLVSLIAILHCSFVKVVFLSNILSNEDH